MPRDNEDLFDHTTEPLTRTAVVAGLRPSSSHQSYSLAAQQRFGHFVIIRTLGRGGMGEVYEAEDVDSGRRVALKVLRQSLGGETDRARFLREGRLAASINHEHVMYVYGSERYSAGSTT
jgi:serine/threonine protein kinase